MLLGERAAGFSRVCGHLCLQIGVTGLLHAAVGEGVVALAGTKTTNSVVLAVAVSYTHLKLPTKA